MAVLAQADYSPIGSSIRSQLNARSVEYAARRIGFDRRRFEANRKSFEIAEKQLDLQMSMADLQQKIADRNITFSWINLGLAGGQAAVNVGSAIYQYNLAADEQKSKRMQTEANSEYEAAAYNAIRNGSFKMIDSGGGVMEMPATIEGFDSITADYENRFDTTLSTKAGKAMAAQGLADVKAGALSWARAQAFNESRKEFENGFTQNKTSAVQNDIANSGVSGPSYDFTNSLMDATSRVLSPERARYERDALERAVTRGWLEKSASGIAAAEGPEAAREWVERESENLERQGKAVSAEEKEDLRKAAAAADIEKTAQSQQTAKAQFFELYQGIDEGSGEVIGMRPNEVAQSVYNHMQSGGRIRKKDEKAVKDALAEVQGKAALDIAKDYYNRHRTSDTDMATGWKIWTKGHGFNDFDGASEETLIDAQNLFAPYDPKKAGREKDPLPNARAMMKAAREDLLRQAAQGTITGTDAMNLTAAMRSGIAEAHGVEPWQIEPEAGQSTLLHDVVNYIANNQGTPGVDSNGILFSMPGMVSEILKDLPKSEQELIQKHASAQLIDFIANNRIGTGETQISAKAVENEMRRVLGGITSQKLDFLREDADGNLLARQSNLKSIAPDLARWLEQMEAHPEALWTDGVPGKESDQLLYGLSARALDHVNEVQSEVVADAMGVPQSVIRSSRQYELENNGYDKKAVSEYNIPGTGIVRLRGKDGKLFMEKKTDGGWEAYTPPNPAALKGPPNPIGEAWNDAYEAHNDERKNQVESKHNFMNRPIPTSEDLKRKNK
jgi:hypothetical protein